MTPLSMVRALSPAEQQDAIRLLKAELVVPLQQFIRQWPPGSDRWGQMGISRGFLSFSKATSGETQPSKPCAGFSTEKPEGQGDQVSSKWFGGVERLYRWRQAALCVVWGPSPCSVPELEMGVGWAPLILESGAGGL